MKTAVTVLGLMMLTCCGWAAAQDLLPGEEVPERARLIEYRVFFEGEHLDTYMEYNWETVNSNGVKRFFAKSVVEGSQIEEIIADGKEREIAHRRMGLTERKYKVTFDGKRYHLSFKGLLQERFPTEITYSNLGNLCQQEETSLKFKTDVGKGKFYEFEGALYCRALE